MPNRHIALPNTTLKEFVDTDNKLWYLDLTNKIIYPSTPPEFMTDIDYYSEEIDRLFSDKIETTLGKLKEGIIKDIEKQEIQPSKLRFWRGNGPKELQDFSKKLIAIQSLRNPDYTRKKTLPHFRCLSYEGRIGARNFANEFLNPNNGLAMYNKYLEVFYTAHGFDAYRTIVLINKTERKFVLPTTHYYYVKKLPNIGENCYVIVVSPQISWILVANDDFRRHFEIQNGECIPRVTNAETINIMNFLSYKFENEFGSKKIVGAYNELEALTLMDTNL